jgi:hypothetical protein
MVVLFSAGSSYATTGVPERTGTFLGDYLAGVRHTGSHFNTPSAARFQRYHQRSGIIPVATAKDVYWSQSISSGSSGPSRFRFVAVAATQWDADAYQHDDSTN